MKRQVIIQHPPRERSLPKPILEAQKRVREAREKWATASRERSELARRRQTLEAERHELVYSARGAALVPGAPAVGSDLDEQLAEHDEFTNAQANDFELKESGWKAAQNDLHKASEEHGSVVYAAAAKSAQRVPEAVAALPSIIPDWFTTIVQAMADRATDRKLVEDLQQMMPKTHLANEQRRQGKAYVRAASQPSVGAEATVGFLLCAVLQWSRHLPELADYWREHGVEPLPWPVGGPERSPILVASELWQLMAGEVPQL